MRVLLTRRADMNRRTGKILAKQGIESVSLPLSEIVDTGETVPEGEYDGLVVTSQAAIDCLLARTEELSRVKKSVKELFCVGETTARALGKAGLSQPLIVASTSDNLTEMLCERNDLHKLLYLAGVDRFSELDVQLKAQGKRVDLCEIYKAELTDPGKSALCQALSESNDGAGFLFSTRTATHLFNLCARYDLNDQIELRGFVAISNNLANSVEPLTSKPIWIAEQPNLTAMIEAARRLYH